MRLSVEEYACFLAYAASLRSEYPHTKVGCVVLDRDNRILSIGYNGLPPKLSIDKNCTREEKLLFMLHAEENALSLVNKQDNPFSIATTISPCATCARSIIAHGIKNVWYLEEYHREQNFKRIFNFAGVGYKQISIPKNVLTFLPQNGIFGHEPSD